MKLFSANTRVSPLSGIAVGSDAIIFEHISAVYISGNSTYVYQRIFKKDVHIHGIKNKLDIGQYKDSLNLYKPK